MPNTRPFLALIVGLFTIGSTLAAPQIGDKAPRVKVAKWVTSAPAHLPGDKDAGKNIFLVEFWATWCGPCRLSIPHLAELHRTLAKEGLIVIGISNEDTATIEKFISKPKTGKPVDMPYHVGADDENETNDAWMKDIDGIPHAFLVDKTGTIVWSGHPMDPDMERALKGVMAGNYDVTTAKNAAIAAKKYDELMKKAQAASEAWEKARAAGETQAPDELFKIIDEMIVVKPQELMPYLMKRHFLGLVGKIDGIQALDSRLEAAMKDSPEGLQQIIEFQFERTLDQRNPGHMLRVARRAEELSKGRDAEVLALLARVQCELGMIDAAIATQDRAVGLASAEDLTQFKRVLQYYKDSKELAKTEKP